MTDLNEPLHDVVRLLDQAGISYAVMGGLAVRVYGIPRATYDIDFTAAIDRRRLPELFQRIEAAGYAVPEEYQTGWIDHVAGLPLVKFRGFLGTNAVDIDLFLAETAFQTELLRRRRQEILDGQPIWIVTAEDLILLKLLAFRPRDIADIGDIRFTQGDLDEDYLRHWAREIGVLDRLEKILAEPAL